MKNVYPEWSKNELKIYILLLCAKADSIETEEELDLIKSKSDRETFDKIYKEFSADDESACLEKIQSNIALHEYSNMELSQLKKEIHEIFLSDKKLHMKERYLDRLLDNILY